MARTINFRGQSYRYSEAKKDSVILKGDAGNDWLAALGGNNRIVTKEGSNVVTAGVNVNFFGDLPLPVTLKGFGVDTIDWSGIANAGNNVVICGDGDDFVVTGAGNDIVRLNGGNNFYDGRAGGSDAISVDNGDNTMIFGRVDQTSVATGRGNNKIIAIGESPDTSKFTVRLGDGNDSVDLRLGKATIDANLGYGTNTASIVSQTVKLISGSGDDFIQIVSRDADVDAGDGRNTLSISTQNWVGNGIVTVKSGTGDDTVDAFVGASPDVSPLATIDAGNGRNRVKVVGNAIVTTGSGDDVISLSGFYGVVKSGAGNDDVTFNAFSGGIIEVGDGNNIVNAGSSRGGTSITAGNGNQQISVEIGRAHV